MIYILEGPDGVGKSTLAAAIAEKTKGHVLHCSWKEEWDMQKYFTEVLACASILNEYQDVVIDRWAPSDYVYGHVFRGGPTSDTFQLIRGANEVVGDIKWVMCQNDNAVLNHLKNKKNREEMFEDMTDVVANFMLFKEDTPELKWIDYNFDKVKMKEWIDEHVTRR